MIRVLEFSVVDGKPQVVELTDEQARAAASVPPPGTLRWVDVRAQTPADVERLGQGFKFHPLALEDCLHFDQRPKLEEYAGQNPYLFVVIHSFLTLPGTAAQLSTTENAMHLPRLLWVQSRREHLALALQETHAFLGQGFLVTVHSRPITAVDTVWLKVRNDPSLIGRGCDFVYYLIADALCDSNFPVLEQIGDILDDLEEAILENPTKNDLHNIYSMRKTMVAMRRVLSPQRDVMGNLSRHASSGGVCERTAPYFRDIYDHLTRIHEGIEAGRDLLGNCVDAYLSAVGQRTNEIMKQLTILSAVMLPMTFLSGLFGMNFEAMPFKSHALFAFALILMFVLLPGGMLLGLRHMGWMGTGSSSQAAGSGPSPSPRRSHDALTPRRAP